jgi:signal-transduction protein with cAMP-binding, CBS, and nucleotidyltransferase domain
MPTFEMLRRESDIRSFKKGEIIFREGDAADFMFAVVDGEVEINFRGAVIERVPRFALQVMQLISERLRRTTAR